MKITCVNCAANHELEPPAWVLQSGRPFRFRCSNCGVSQMVSAPAKPAPAMEPARAAQAGPTIAPTEVPAPEGSNQLVYLKQDGKVYLVRDWATVQRWIMERRVERGDLVSEGGVRWEPIGTRPELGSFFLAIEQLEAAETGNTAAARPHGQPLPWETGRTIEPAPNVSYPFPDGEAEAARSRFGRLDDDTEGVPTGLPVLPTEEVGGEPASAPENPAPPARRSQIPEGLSLSNLPTVLREPETPPTAPSRIPEIHDQPYMTESPDIAPPGLVTPTPVQRETSRSTPTPAERQATPPPISMTSFESGGRETPAPVVRAGVPDSGPMDFGSDLFNSTPPPSQGDDDLVRMGTPMWMWLAGGAVTLLLFVVLLVVAVGVYTNRSTPGRGPEDQPALGQAISGQPDGPREAVEPPKPPETPPAADTDAGAAVPPIAPPVEPTKLEPEPAKAEPAKAPPPEPPKEPAKAEPPKEPAKEPAKVDPGAEPAKAPPKPPSTKKLVDQAWKAVESSNFEGAAATFQKALAQSPGDKDALYGYGYVQLQRGDKDGAKAALCKALAKAGGDDSVRRDVSGLLSQNGLTCD